MPLLHAWAVFEWRHDDRRAARSLFARAEEEAGNEPCSWLHQWRARFEAGQLELRKTSLEEEMSALQVEPP